jgi:hypothetical protein
MRRPEKASPCIGELLGWASMPSCLCQNGLKASPPLNLFVSRVFFNGFFGNDIWKDVYSLLASGQRSGLGTKNTQRGGIQSPRKAYKGINLLKSVGSCHVQCEAVRCK